MIEYKAVTNSGNGAALVVAERIGARQLVSVVRGAKPCRATCREIDRSFNVMLFL